MSILEFLGLRRTDERTDASESAETETVRKIVDRLDHLEPERARFVAAFAYILSRVAHADLEIRRAGPCGKLGSGRRGHSPAPAGLASASGTLS